MTSQTGYLVSLLVFVPADDQPAAQKYIQDTLAQTPIPTTDWKISQIFDQKTLITPQK